MEVKVSPIASTIPAVPVQRPQFLPAAMPAQEQGELKALVSIIWGSRSRKENRFSDYYICIHFQRAPIYTSQKGEKLFLIRPLPKQPPWTHRHNLLQRYQSFLVHFVFVPSAFHLSATPLIRVRKVFSPTAQIRRLTEPKNDGDLKTTCASGKTELSAVTAFVLVANQSHYGYFVIEPKLWTLQCMFTKNPETF